MTDLPYGNPEPVWEGSISIRYNCVQLNINYGDFDFLGMQVRSLSFSVDCRQLCAPSGTEAIAETEAKKILERLLKRPVEVKLHGIETFRDSVTGEEDDKFTFLFFTQMKMSH